MGHRDRSHKTVLWSSRAVRMADATVHVHAGGIRFLRRIETDLERGTHVKRTLLRLHDL